MRSLRAARVISAKGRLAPSRNEYDWLGDGAYFWENNPQRALEFAIESRQRRGRQARRIKKPAVIGAVIDLGYCLNPLDSKYLQILKEGFRTLRQTMDEAGQPMPVNKPVRDGNELLLRNLDCAVINAVHALRTMQGRRHSTRLAARSSKVGRSSQAVHSGKRTIFRFVSAIRDALSHFWPLDEQGNDIIAETPLI